MEEGVNPCLIETSVVPSFSDRLKSAGKFPLKAEGVDIFQMNIGNKCNLSCKHCHIKAGPLKNNEMDMPIFEKCLNVIKTNKFSTIDITGGAPELNSNLEWFIKKAAPLGRRLIVRTNLVVILDDQYRKYMDIYTHNNVEIVCSIPHPDHATTDRMRGNGFFYNAVSVLKELNKRGYGKKGTGRVLNIVHNPVGMYLPASQESIIEVYKEKLNEYGVLFNALFVLTNMPIGNFLNYLKRTNHINLYMETLMDAYNPTAVDNVMCKFTISVGWDGALYDCDFNQALNLPIEDMRSKHIDDFDAGVLKNRSIVIRNHCYGCTAGMGSSCQGATVCESS